MGLLPEALWAINIRANEPFALGIMGILIRDNGSFVAVFLSGAVAENASSRGCLLAAVRLKLGILAVLWWWISRGCYLPSAASVTLVKRIS